MNTTNVDSLSSRDEECPADSKPGKRCYRPRTAGNRAFRLHNSLRFSRTEERRKIGKQNKT